MPLPLSQPATNFQKTVYGLMEGESFINVVLSLFYVTTVSLKKITIISSGI